MISKARLPRFDKYYEIVSDWRLESVRRARQTLKRAESYIYAVRSCCQGLSAGRLCERRWRPCLVSSSIDFETNPMLELPRGELRMRRSNAALRGNVRTFPVETILIYSFKFLI